MAELEKMKTEEQNEPEEKDRSLEDLFGELDDILAAMDERDITLEDSFALYEKGMKRVAQCNEKLDMVEKKMLAIAGDGSEVPFEE